MKTISLLVFLLILLNLTADCAARETCRLDLKNAPILFGLRLEMTPAEVKSVFGKELKLKIKKEGTFFQNFIKKPPPPFLKGVRALYLRFFDARLYQIEVFYEPENQRRTLKEFTDQIGVKLNLPPEAWLTEYGTAELNCTDFSIVADNVLNPRLQLTDEPLRARFEASQKK